MAASQSAAAEAFQSTCKANYLEEEKRRKEKKMAVRFTISMLALVLLAPSYASATTVEGLCKGTYDDSYCVTLLKPIATESTDFKSGLWEKEVRSKAMEKVVFAQDFMIQNGKDLDKLNNHAAGMCDNKFRESIELIKNGDSMDFAANSLAACSDSLEDSPGIMKDIRVKVEEAITASRVVDDVISSKH